MRKRLSTATTFSVSICLATVILLLSAGRIVAANKNAPTGTNSGPLRSFPEEPPNYELIASAAAAAGMAHLNKSDTQQRKNSPRSNWGRFAMDWSFLRARCLSSSLVFA